MIKFVSLLSLILIIVLGTLYAQKPKPAVISANYGYCENSTLIYKMTTDSMKFYSRTDLTITSINLMQLESMLKIMNGRMGNGMMNYIIKMQKDNMRNNKISSTQILW